MKVHLWDPGHDPSAGGIQTYSAEVLNALVALGMEVRPISHQGSRWKFCMHALTAVFFDRPDLVFTTHAAFLTLARIAKKLTGIQVAASLHGIEAWNLTARALAGADILLPVGAFTRTRVENSSGLASSLFEVLPNTFDDQRFQPGPRPERLENQFGLKKTSKILLTVGRLDPREAYKGQDRVIECLPGVIQDFPDAVYLIAGEGWDRTRLEYLAKSAGLEDRVIFTGRVSADDLPDLYRLCDVFVMPSSGEGFGVTYLEAMACGRPVIGGNRDGGSDALDGGALGLLVDPFDTAQITNAIVRTLRGETPLTSPTALHSRVLQKFGRAEFRAKLAAIMKRFSSCAA